MTPGNAIVLLGFGIGALVVAGRSGSREATHGAGGQLRADVIAAQHRAAQAAANARDLFDQWSAAQAKEQRP